MDNLLNELLQIIISYQDELTKYHIYTSSYLLSVQRQDKPLKVINAIYDNYSLVKYNDILFLPTTTTNEIVEKFNSLPENNNY